MIHGKRKFAAVVLTVASMGWLAASASAVIYTETGDAGMTLGTANVATPNYTGLPTGLTQINGTISTPTDADLYQINLTSGMTLTLTTTSVAGIDTELALFSSTGVAIVENDDANGFTLNSSFTITLAAGTYYVGVALSGNEPVNSANQLLFTGLSQNGDTTAVRGPASGVNPNTLSGYNGNDSFAETGDYSIGITSAVPEPGTWALFAFGALATGFTFLRRRRA